MLLKASTLAAYLAAVVAATPTHPKRAVTSVNAADVAESQQRDNTATRAFSNVEVQVGLFC
jgi:hypothetical protein